MGAFALLAASLLKPELAKARARAETKPRSVASARQVGVPKRPTDPYAGLDHTGTPSTPSQEGNLPGHSAPQGAHRRAPNYDGAKAPRRSAGEALIWIPRVVFFPVYLTLEYAVRWPLVKLITVLEKHYVIERVKSFFSFANGRGTWMPTFLKDLGQFNQVGAYFQLRDLGVEGHTLTLQAGFWTGHWYHVKAVDEMKAFRRNQGTVSLRGEFKYRPDSIYYGLGPDSVIGAKSFYRIRHTEVELALRCMLAGLNRFRAGISFRNVSLEPGKETSIDSPSRAIYWDAEDQQQVPGFGRTYNLLSTQLRLDLDTRSPKSIDTPGSGVRLELLGSHHIDPGNTHLHFARWSGELAGFWDVSGRNHVLALRVFAAGQESIGDGLIPIHERIMLGGKETLRGFGSGRFRGDSALVISAQYRYPIWWMLDANLFVSAGNVFTGRFDDFSFRRMVMSWGVGLRTNTSKDVSFDVLLAFGSNQIGQWEDKFRLAHVRLLFGINQGF